MTLTNNASVFKKALYSFFFFIISIQFVYADSLDASRENAKKAYFSGELESSLSVFLTLSESGDTESQYYAGLIYLTEGWSGRHVEKALAYLTTAADKNSTDAMWKIGEVYENGWGTEKNILTALDWYRKSQQATLYKSNIQFAVVKNRQLELKSNQDMINKLVKEAKQGNAESAYKLAKVYDEGRFVKQNHQSSFNWYKKAADMNHKYSMLMLGYYWCRGVGVEFNKNKANKWIKSSERKAYFN